MIVVLRVFALSAQYLYSNIYLRYLYLYQIDKEQTRLSDCYFIIFNYA